MNNARIEKLAYTEENGVTHVCYAIFIGEQVIKMVVQLDPVVIISCEVIK